MSNRLRANQSNSIGSRSSKPISEFAKQYSQVSPSNKNDTKLLVCTAKELDDCIEDEIRAGFFELKQKFSEEGPSSIYISHIVLSDKHPIFKKCEMETLKRLLVESSIVYLMKDQILYKFGSR